MSILISSNTCFDYTIFCCLKSIFDDIYRKLDKKLFFCCSTFLIPLKLFLLFYPVQKNDFSEVEMCILAISDLKRFQGHSRHQKSALQNNNNMKYTVFFKPVLYVIVIWWPKCTPRQCILIAIIWWQQCTWEVWTPR